MKPGDYSHGWVTGLSLVPSPGGETARCFAVAIGDRSFGGVCAGAAWHRLGVLVSARTMVLGRLPGGAGSWRLAGLWSGGGVDGAAGGPGAAEEDHDDGGGEGDGRDQGDLPAGHAAGDLQMDCRVGRCRVAGRQGQEGRCSKGSGRGGSEGGQGAAGPARAVRQRRMRVITVSLGVVYVRALPACARRCGGRYLTFCKWAARSAPE